MAQDGDGAGRLRSPTKIQAHKLTHTVPGQMLFLLPLSLEEATMSLRRGPGPPECFIRLKVVDERELAWE